MKEPFPESPPDFWGRVRRAVRFGAYICLLVVVICLVGSAARALWCYSTMRNVQATPLPDPVRAIVEARDAGQYEKALQLAADGAVHHPEMGQIRELKDQMERDFKPEFGLDCNPVGKPLFATAKEKDCERLAPEDEFFVDITLPNAPELPEAQRRYYAYLFLVDSSGDWKALLPNRTNANPLPPDHYTVPAVTDYKVKLHPSVKAGAEKLFLVVAWWRIPAFETLATDLMAEPDVERRRGLGDQVAARLQLEGARPIDVIKGLKVGHATFNSSGKN